MKKILLAAVAAVGVLALAGGAFAGTDTASVSASASVAGVCKVTAGGSIPFGALDQLTGAAVTPVVIQPAFWCTKSLPFSITDDNGVYELGATYRLKASLSADYIPYTFTYITPGSGSGKTTPLNPGITASIAANAYDTVPADSYSDTVTLTINY